MRTAAAVIALASVCVAGYWTFDALRRNRAIESFATAMAAAQPGDTLDVRAAMPLDWDRVIVIGPYEQGASANQELGFRHYADDEWLIESDSGQLIIFVNDQIVVADHRNLGPTYFAEDVRSFSRDAAEFVRSPGGTLRPVGVAT